MAKAPNFLEQLETAHQAARAAVTLPEQAKHVDKLAGIARDFLTMAVNLAREAQEAKDADKLEPAIFASVRNGQVGPLYTAIACPRCFSQRVVESANVIEWNSQLLGEGDLDQVILSPDDGDGSDQEADGFFCRDCGTHLANPEGYGDLIDVEYV